MLTNLHYLLLRSQFHTDPHKIKDHSTPGWEGVKKGHLGQSVGPWALVTAASLFF